jgi:hypothetical protein
LLFIHFNTTASISTIFDMIMDYFFGKVSGTRKSAWVSAQTNLFPSLLLLRKCPAVTIMV